MKNKRMFIAIPIILVLFIIIGGLIYNGFSKPKPILKVLTLASNNLNLASAKNYYIVYENKKIRKTTEFIPKEVERYYFSDSGLKDIPALNSNTSLDYDTLNRISNDIVNLVNATKYNIISVNKMFVLEGRYFVDVLCDKSSKIFEYIPEEDKVIEIASFKSQSIDHIELYK